MGWQVFSVIQLIAGNTIINPNGAFLYSGTPGVGNLIASIAPTSTTQDNFGNPVTGGGFASYGNAADTIYALLTTGQLQFQSAAGQPVLAGVVSSAAGAIAVTSGTVGVGDSVAEILLESAQANDGTNRLVELIGEQLLMPVTVVAVAGGLITIQNAVTITGAVSTGTLTVNGSTSTQGPSTANTSTNGLTNGQIAGTSGAASAGTAHTHGAGSYAVTNGQHNHTLSAHTHVL